MTWDVRAAGWIRRTSDDGIEDVVGTGALVRGIGYADSDMVVRASTESRGETIVADVVGSGSRVYHTVITLIDDDEDDVLDPDWISQCSCPVGEDCKHVVAVLVAARRRLGAATGEMRWESALSGFADTAQDSSTGRESGTPLALVIELAAPAGPYAPSAMPRVQIQPTRRTKAGRWAKRCSWGEAGAPIHGYSFHRTAPTARESHRRLLQELVQLRRATVSRVGVGYGEATVYLDDFGPSVWPLLRRVREAGVELIGSSAGEPVTLHDDPVETVVDVVRDQDGLRIFPALDGTPFATDVDPEPLSITLIGDPSHGVAVRRGAALSLASFAAPLEPAVASFVQGSSLHVPTADVDRFMGQYLPGLRERVSVISSDNSVDLTEPTPPRLHVRVWGGQPGRLHLDLGFVYARESGDQIVPAGHGGGIPRDAKGEAALVADVEELHAVPGARSMVFGPSGQQLRLQPIVTLRGEAAVRVRTVAVPLLQAHPDVVVVVDDDVPAYEELAAEPQIAIGAPADQPESDWLDLSVAVTVDGQEVPFESLFEALVRGDEIMLLDSGGWFRLDHPSLTQLRTLIEEARELSDHEAGQLRLSRYQASLWDDLSDLGEVDIERQRGWLRSVEALRAVETKGAPAVPESLQASLRPYQLEGFHWLATLWDAGLGGVLADDMGLGKTVQTLALLARAAEAGDLDHPVLVVAPTSVVGTWASEAERFVPDLDVRVLGQTHKRRGTGVGEAVDGAQLVITSYAVLRIDAEQFADVQWRGLVIDEAQFVKNAQAKTHQALRRLETPFVVAVTGTPLENSLMDLWALFSLAAPGLYPRRDRFTEVYRKPIESGAEPERLDQLRRRIRPLMLRRTKDQVALDLPPKQTQVLSVELTPAHRRIYDRHLQRERKRVLGLLDDPDANRVAILASLTKLRQLSLDPSLVDEEHRGQVSSAKVELLVEDLRELAGEGHRALVFSQFTRFLGVVRERLSAEGVSTCYLDGSTRNRGRVIDEFRQGDATAFLISLKAGGVGLTLTEADYVFVLDPWWNPAAESQAIDRAHRIGQDKPVMVYRLVSTGTIEEKVLALQERKRDLFERVVDDGGALSGKITASDIRALLDTQ